MRRFLISLIVISVLLTIGCKKETQTGGAEFHIGLVTGTVSQSEDDLRGAEKLMEMYGKASEGGMIQHVTYPDNFMQEQETTITQIVGLSDDPLMKAIIVNQGIPGTKAAFEKIRARRDDILLIAGEAHEDPLVIQTVSDLVINNDFMNRGYLIIHTAKQLGCDTFVHISFPRHMSYETLSTRRDIMEKACNDLGLKFIFETAPDPVSDVGVAGAQQYILQKVEAWVDKYGKNTAFFCTNDAHTEPLLKQLITYGGYFIEADLPSPLMGYPGALGIDLSGAQGDFKKILKTVEDAVVAKGGGGRFGTWAYSYGFTNTAALGQHAINVLKKESELTKIEDLMKAYNQYTPGAKWNGINYTDRNTGVTANHHLLIYQDTYIMGKGYMNATEVKVPEKYLK